MMKKLIYLCLLLLNGITSYSQNYGKDLLYQTKPFQNGITSFFYLSNINGKSLSVTADSKTSRVSLVITYPNKPRTNFIHLEGASKISLYSSIITDSLKYYRYTVIQDDTVYLAKDLVPIINPTTGFEFGPYNVTNKKISFFIYEVGKKEEGRETIIFCKKFKPVEIVEAKLVEVYESPRLLKLVKNSKGDTTSIEQAVSEANGLNVNGSPVPINPKYSYATITIKPIDNFFLYKVLLKRTDWLANTDVTPIAVNWEFDTFGNLNCKIDPKKFEKPGKYEIVIYPNRGNTGNGKIENVTSIKFEMKRPSLTNKQLGTYAIIVLVALLVLFAVVVFSIKRKNKKKLLIEQQQKSLTQMQLSAVRSQLNPHFMFNALAGIQSLMNKNKTEEANEYLGKFARITRNVLDNQELTSLADEKALLNDYLQMEQFRFGFNYKIETAEELDLENTEIPSMLLQPFVENAVKHGIAESGTEGKIAVFFKQAQNNLILEVKDNGQGFDTSKKYQGLGLQLSKDRIALLNNIYKETPFIMEIMANDKGTIITITLVNWL